MLTLEQRRDRFKVRCRPIVQRYWTTVCGGSIGSCLTRECFRAWAIHLFLNEIIPEIEAMWGPDAPRITSDAEPVIHELIDELPTVESTN